MRTLKLGMRGLPTRDEQLIRNLMRMFAHDPLFHWELSKGDELDVVALDVKLAANKPRCRYRAVLLLSDSPVPEDDHVLTRPLQASAFRHWLISAESALSQADTSTLIDTSFDRGQANGSKPASKPLRFKLRSWPPSIMLRSDPMLERMAQLLSDEAMTMNELGQASGAPITVCQNFLRKLQLLGLLDISVPRAPAEAIDVLPAPPKPSLAVRLRQMGERFMGLGV